jgi:tetratricopeptide (TPR) repeat protein
MKQLVGRTALGLALVLASASTAGGVAHAQQQNVDEGRTRFSRGIELYKEGNFHGALAEFRAAYAAAPSFRIHYNLGQTLYQLQDYAGAVRAFEQYLSEGGDKVDPDRKKEVEGDLAKLRPRVAKLSLVVNVPSADVVVDDEPRGTAVKQGLLLSAGRHRISVTAPGYQTETRAIDVAGAQEVELKLELKPIATATASPAPVVAAPPPVRSRSRTPFYVGLVATGALGAGTAVMAIVTSSNHSDYETAIQVPDNERAIKDTRDRTHTTAIVADVLGGATVLAGGLTVLAYVLTSGTEPVPSAKTTQPSVRFVVGAAAAGLSGTF